MSEQLAIPIGDSQPTSSISVTERGVSHCSQLVSPTPQRGLAGNRRPIPSRARVLNERYRNLPTGDQIEMPPTAR